MAIFLVLFIALCAILYILYLRKKANDNSLMDNGKDDDEELNYRGELVSCDADDIALLLKTYGLSKDDYYTLCAHLDHLCLDLDPKLVDDLEAQHGRTSDEFLHACLLAWLGGKKSKIPKTCERLVNAVIDASGQVVANKISNELEKSQDFYIVRNYVPQILQSLVYPEGFFRVLSHEKIVDTTTLSADDPNGGQDVLEAWFLSQLKRSLYQSPESTEKIMEALEIFGCRQIAIDIAKECGHGINLQPLDSGNEMSQHFEEAFSDIKDKTKEDGCDIKMLKECVLWDPNSTLKLQMKDCSNTESFWEAVKNDCSSIDIKSLEQVVRMLNVKPVTECLGQYKKRLHDFCQGKQISYCLGKVYYRLPTIQTPCQMISLVVKRCLEQRTISNVKDLLTTAFGNESESVKICEVILKTNSFMVTCFFPITLSSRLIANGVNNLLELTTKEGMLRLTVGYCIVYDEEANIELNDLVNSVDNDKCRTKLIDQIAIALEVQMMEKKDEIREMNLQLKITEIFEKRKCPELIKNQELVDLAILSQACEDTKAENKVKGNKIEELQDEVNHLKADLQNSIYRRENFNAKEEERIKVIEQIKGNKDVSQRIHHGQSPEMFKLITDRMAIHDKIFKCTFGTPDNSKRTKVILLVGETGAGKSTLINGMVNYILGVKFEDDLRFKLICDETTKSPTHSQTNTVTAYTFYWQEGFQVPYNLTIIDTPGFGEIVHDYEVSQLLGCLFSSENVNEIHGIGFVIRSSLVQSSLVQLTPTQRYNINSILGIFGKDMKDNIFVIVTHADNSYPVVLGLKEAKVPFTKTFFVNNYGLYHEAPITKQPWDKSYISYEDMLLYLNKLNPVTLQLSSEVLKERQQLQITLTGLQKLLQDKLVKKDQIDKEEEMLRNKIAEMAAEKEYEKEDRIIKQIRIELMNETAANCKNCNVTCQYPCNIPDDEMDESHAMNIEGECLVCPGKCSWRDHTNQSHRFEEHENVEKTISLEKLQRYQEAEARKVETENVISTLKDELAQLLEKVQGHVDNVKQHLHCLNDKALYPNPLEHADDYLNVLIEGEKKEKKKGSQDRIDRYVQIKEQANILSEISATRWHQ